MKFDIGENVFWLAAWIVVAVVIGAIISNINDYYQRKNEIVASAIAKSSVPMQVACAIKLEDLQDKSICMATLQQKGTYQ